MPKTRSWHFSRPSRRTQVILVCVVLLFVLLFVLAPDAWGDLGGVLVGFIPNMLIEAADNIEKALNIGSNAFVAHLP